MRLAVCVAGAGAALYAQEPGGGWAGAWGTFQRMPQSGKMAAYFEGQGLSVADCDEQRCTVSFLVQEHTGHAEARGDLLIENATEAVARLGVPEKCTLALEKSGGAQPAITVTARTGDCSYFATPGASFAHRYPLRARTPFSSELFLPECFVGDSRAQMALCTSPVLAQQEHDWIGLLWSVSDLGAPGLDMKTERAKLLQSCDGAADARACMAEAFRRSTDELHARAAAWKATVTEPGDAAQAERAIAAIAGTYRRSFANGDVQGDKFTATDTLEIRRAGDDAIHYDVYLEFFNGHECNRTGVAKYRRNGAFVEQTKVETPAAGSKLCAFEIIPAADGVQLRDVTGMCKMESCALRGGFNGAVFKFSERVAAAKK